MNASTSLPGMLHHKPAFSPVIQRPKLRRRVFESLSLILIALKNPETSKNFQEILEYAKAPLASRDTK
jgi:hypothetical protein